MEPTPNSRTQRKRIQERHSPREWLLALHASTGKQVGLVIDLSLCGVHLLSRDEYEPGDEIHLALQTPTDFDGPPEIRTKGVCRWCRPTPDGRFDIGMEISEEVSFEGLTALAEIYFRHSD